MADLVELDVDTCLQLLGHHHVGRLAVNDDDGPIVVPVNYILDRGTVVIRSDPGTKVNATVERDRAAFEIDGIDEDRRIGWSVLVRGRLREIVSEHELERLRELPLESFAGGEKAHYLRLDSSSITGRRIELPSTIPHDWFEAADLGNIWFRQDGSDLLG